MTSILPRLRRGLSHIHTVCAILYIGLFPLVLRACCDLEKQPGVFYEDTASDEALARSLERLYGSLVEQEVGLMGTFSEWCLPASLVVFFYASYWLSYFKVMSISMLVSLLAQKHLDWDFAACLYACYACFANFRLGFYTRCLVSARAYQDKTRKQTDELLKFRAEIQEESEKTKSIQAEALTARDNAISEYRESSAMHEAAIAQYEEASAIRAGFHEKEAQKQEVMTYLLNAEKELEQRKEVAVACSKPLFQSGNGSKSRKLQELEMELREELDRKLNVIEEAFTKAQACMDSEAAAEIALMNPLLKEAEGSNAAGDGSAASQKSGEVGNLKLSRRSRRKRTDHLPHEVIEIED